MSEWESHLVSVWVTEWTTGWVRNSLNTIRQKSRDRQKQSRSDEVNLELHWTLSLNHLHSDMMKLNVISNKSLGVTAAYSEWSPIATLIQSDQQRVTTLGSARLTDSPEPWTLSNINIDSPSNILFWNDQCPGSCSFASLQSNRLGSYWLWFSGRRTGRLEPTREHSFTSCHTQPVLITVVWLTSSSLTHFPEQSSVDLMVHWRCNTQPLKTTNPQRAV